MEMKGDDLVLPYRGRNPGGATASRTGGGLGLRQSTVCPVSAPSCYPFTADMWVKLSHSPLGIFFFHLGQASCRVRQIVPKGTDISSFQSAVDQNHSREHLHSHKELLLAQLL